MSNQREIEQLLRNVPLSAPGQVSAAETMFGIFMNLRNAAFEGSGVSLPGTATAFSVPAIIDQMRAGNYADAAVTLISIVGDAAGAYSFLVTAGIEAEAIAGVGAAASSGVVAGMVGEVAGPAGIAAAVLVETFRIPSGVTENNAKLYYIADASGILTSWLFNLPAINHTRDCWIGRGQAVTTELMFRLTAVLLMTARSTYGAASIRATPTLVGGHEGRRRIIGKPIGSRWPRH